MASRAIVPEQVRGEAAARGGKQKKAGAEGRSRKALGDIGNLVSIQTNDCKPLPLVSRPVTRSYHAKLLANEQAAENNKVFPNQAKQKVNELPKPKPKVVRKKVTIKPPTENVIEVSSDSEEEVKKEKLVNKKKEGTRKKAVALTSVLTARSKAACGLSNKPKVEDIDAGDVNNELAAVEYVEDMYKFYKAVENESQVQDYLEFQPEINEKMRAILVDWLIEIHNKFELEKVTLYLTINIVDRFLSATIVPRRELQLVGLGAMLMASKYEEIWAPEVNDFVCFSDGAYSHQQILVMEKTILGKLEWTLTVPTPYVFLVRFIKASLSDEKMESMVHFFAELGMVQYATIKYCPSMIAASAVYAARCTLSKSPAWNDTLKLHTGFSEQQLIDCAKLLVGFHRVAAENKLKVVYTKFSDPERHAVALLPPAKALLAATS